MIRTSKRGLVRRTSVIQSLNDLSLDETDLADLRRQGSVSREPRGAAFYYKLRFRSSDGRQHVRYLGNDATVAEKIRTELEALQLPQQQRQALKRTDADARQLLRQVKQQVRSGLDQLGFRFHGYEIRQRRA